MSPAPGPVPPPAESPGTEDERDRPSLVALVAALRRRPSRLAVRLLAFNLLLVFLPALALLSLDVYERQLLRAQERSMVQQGRVLAAALGGTPTLDGATAERVLSALGERRTARLRVVDREGDLVADSSRLGPRASPDAASGDGTTASTRSRPLYRIGAFAFRLADRIAPPQGTGAEDPNVYPPGRPLLGQEVLAALVGRYGAATRPSPGQRSITLYSAIPIRDGDTVTGAVLVSQSTLGILRDLYDLRLAVFKVTLVALAVAVVLTLLVSTRIVAPIQRLRAEAATLLDRRGRLRGRFGGSPRRDEIGDLARALEELSRRLGEHLDSTERFAAELSHEIKNPLASIRSASQMLAEVEEPATRRRFLRLVEGEVARLERLLAGLREVAALDAGTSAEAPVAVDLRALAEALVDAQRVRGASVELRAAEGALVVEGDADRLVQALENLLDNAVGFSPPGVQVELCLEREDNGIVVKVADRGPGIPPEHRSRVFERFFSYRPAEPGAKRRHTGLGLAIVKAIAESHGGTVAAHGRSGGGAVVELRLPAR